MVRLRGLPFSASELDVADFLSCCKISRRGIHLVPYHHTSGLCSIPIKRRLSFTLHQVFNRFDKPTGEAFVELETNDDIRKALSKHSNMLSTRSEYRDFASTSYLSVLPFRPLLRYIEVFESSQDDIRKALREDDVGQSSRIQREDNGWGLEADAGSADGWKRDGWGTSVRQQQSGGASGFFCIFLHVPLTIF